MAPTNGTAEDNGLVSESIKNIFRKFLQEEGVTVSNINIKAGSIKGDNYLGIIAKAEVTGKDSEGKPFEKSYIIKSAPKSEGLRSFAPIDLAYEREIYMYSKVLPKFKEFQAEKGIKKPFAEYAQCLITSDEDKDEALILQDMKALGFDMQNRKYALSYDHIKLVIYNLARYHALSFAFRDQNPELFDEFIKNTERNYFNEMKMDNFDVQADMQCEKARKTLNSETDQEAIDRFQKYRPSYFKDFTAMLNDQCNPYSVIRHGDCWTNNILFAYEDKANPKVPTKVCFLDWQLSQIGPPVLDLLYFLYACTDKDLRDKHFDQLFKDYHQTLKEFTAELGSDIEKLYPFSIMLEQLKKFGKYGLSAAVMLLPVLTSDSEEIPDINEVFDAKEGEESIKHVMDAFNFESKNAEMFNIRMRDVILHAVEKNFI